MKFQLWYPVKPLNFNQKFGNIDPVYTNMGLAGHNGIDFMALHGQPVYASHDGTCYPEIDGTGGNGVVIRTDETFDYNGEQVHWKTIYWHLMKADAVVKTGQKVKAGDLIGYADNTGTSTGDHLHFGLKPQAWNEESWSWYNPAQNNGYLGAIDPMPYFNGYFAQDKNLVISSYQKLLGLYQQLLSAIKK
jgi:murein DD-endopeptidase MepM/ murein hydrolase activator NlpD